MPLPPQPITTTTLPGSSLLHAPWPTCSSIFRRSSASARTRKTSGSGRTRSGPPPPRWRGSQPPPGSRDGRHSASVLGEGRDHAESGRQDHWPIVERRSPPGRSSVVLLVSPARGELLRTRSASWSPRQQVESSQTRQPPARQVAPGRHSAADTSDPVRPPGCQTSWRVVWRITPPLPEHSAAHRQHKLRVRRRSSDGRAGGELADGRRADGPFVRRCRRCGQWTSTTGLTFLGLSPHHEPVMRESRPDRFSGICPPVRPSARPTSARRLAAESRADIGT